MSKAVVVNALDRVSAELANVDKTTFSPASKLRQLNELVKAMTVMGQLLLANPEWCDEDIANRGRDIVDELIAKCRECKKALELSN